MRPTTGDAARRVVVRWGDGRTGRLLSVPGRSGRLSAGAKARVVLGSGAVVSVPVDELRVCREVTGGSRRLAAHELVLLPRLRG